MDIREAVLTSIEAGDRVTIVNRFGQESIGQAVTLGPTGWVLDIVGRTVTRGIATPENIRKIK